MYLKVAQLSCVHRMRIEEEQRIERMERERIDKEATEAALRQMAELDEQLQVSDGFMGGNVNI